MTSGTRNGAEVYLQASGTGEKGQLSPAPRGTMSQDTAPHWTWRLQVERAAGMEIPEGAARTGGFWERACTAGGFLASGQGREGESLQA